MSDIIENIRTLSIQMKNKERLPLGNKSRGRYIKTEDGQPDILIPSFGLLEKEEIDYIAEANIEKEKKRVRVSPKKAKMEEFLRVPKEDRRKYLDEKGGK
jgi:hypothetical protein